MAFTLHKQHGEEFSSVVLHLGDICVITSWKQATNKIMRESNAEDILIAAGKALEGTSDKILNRWLLPDSPCPEVSLWSDAQFAVGIFWSMDNCRKYWNRKWTLSGSDIIVGILWYSQGNSKLQILEHLHCYDQHIASLSLCMWGILGRLSNWSRKHDTLHCGS